MATRYVVLYNSKVYQINNVTGCSITSPSVTDGTYRDQPPVVVGGASAVAYSLTGDPPTTVTVAGGVSPAASNTNITGANYFMEASGASSVAQDDTYTHTAPRDYTFKLALLVFTTSDGITTYDCFFKLAEVSGVFNQAPQGWSVS